MKKNKTIEYFLTNLKLKIDVNLINNINNLAYKNYEELTNKYKNDSKKMKKLTLNNMFPVISIYKALIASNFSKRDAFNLVNEINSKKKLNEAIKTSKMLKHFGLYKLYPTIFKKVTLSSFSSDIGFEPEFVITNKKQCKFNMKKCVFCERCREENCFELVKAFCNTDDVFNTNLHQNIIWKRESTLADSSPFCDFDVSIKEEE